MAKQTKPHPLVLAVKLAGDHVAGVLLYRILTWAQYAKAKIPGEQGEWIANKREWWCCEAALTPSQYDRAMARLDGQQLVERRQWWWGGRNILFVRPSKITREYVQAAKTWKAAEEFLPAVQLANAAKIEKPASANPLNSNGVDHPSDLTSSEMVNPKDNKKNKQVNNTKGHTSAPTAPPPCGDKTQGQGKDKAPGEDEKQKYELGGSTKVGGQPHDQALPSLNQVMAAWCKAIAMFGGQQSYGLPAHHKGELAEFADAIEYVDTGHGVEDLRSRAPDIVFFAVRVRCKSGPPLDFCKLKHLNEVLDVIGEWHAAGRPSHAVN